MRFVYIFLTIMSLLGLVSCGGGGGSTSAPQQPPAVQVGVSPVSATLNVTMSQQFSAQVLNSASSTVTWSVQEPGGGTINAAGLYNAPATAGTYHVVAAATADPTRSATATVTVQPPVAVSIAAIPDVNVGHAEQLSATVSNNANKSVTWAVQEGVNGGSVTSAGLYTAPVAPGKYHVVATSVADATKSDTTAVTVLPPVAVTIAPAPNLMPGQSAQLTATVANTTNNSVTWAVQEGTAGGSVSATGVYTAPSAPGSYHIIATSVADTSASATSAVGVFAVTITPGTPIINPGQTVQLAATVANAANKSVTWSVQEGASGGTVAADGSYVAPVAPGTYHVVAASQFDPGISSAATIIVTEPVQAQLFMNKASQDAADIFLTFVGDSTCYSYGYTTYPNVSIKRWCLFVAEELAQKLPQYTVKYRQWNYGTDSGPAGMSYDGWATLQNGAGEHTLWISNASFPGATSYDFLAGRFADSIVATTPDLVVDAMGHNYTWNCPTYWPNLTLDLTESITAALPNTGLILVSPNATTPAYVHSDTTAGKVDTIANVAQWRRYGYINVFQAFLESGYPLAQLLINDGMHPTAPNTQVGPENGSHLFAAEVSKYFVRSNGVTSPQQPSALTQSTTQYVTNGTFQDFPASSKAPTGWTLLGTGSVSKDPAHSETANGYSVKVASAAAAAYIQQFLPVKKVAGQCVTVTARVWVDAGQPMTAGRITLGDNISFMNTTYSTNIAFGAWRWESLTRCFDPGINQAYVRLFGDTTTTNGAASFDQVSVTIGPLPHAQPAF